jgi:Protein of unknown function (DUF726)
MSNTTGLLKDDAISLKKVSKNDRKLIALITASMLSTARRLDGALSTEAVRMHESLTRISSSQSNTSSVSDSDTAPTSVSASTSAAASTAAATADSQPVTDIPLDVVVARMNSDGTAAVQPSPQDTIAVDDDVATAAAAAADTTTAATATTTTTSAASAAALATAHEANEDYKAVMLPSVDRRQSDNNSHSDSKQLATSDDTKSAAVALEERLPWEEDALRKLVKYLDLPEREFTALEPLLHDDVDPRPFLEALGWNKPEQKQHLILILLHFAVVGMNGLDARIQVQIRRLSVELRISWQDVLELQLKYAATLRKAVEEAATKKPASGQKMRWLKIGGLAVVGGAAIALTGGLAAPAIGAGVAAVGLGGTGAFLGSTLGVALVTTVFGVAGTGLVGAKAHRRFQEVQEFKFARLREMDSKRLAHVLESTVDIKETSSDAKYDKSHQSMQAVLCIDGWTNGVNQYHATWQPVISQHAPHCENYALLWERDLQKQISDAIASFVKSHAVDEAKKQIIAQTVLRGLFAAIAWPMAVLDAANMIDNTWTLAMSRTRQVGIMLADTLAERAHGNRPVVLIGYSFGARVIFFALLELAKRSLEGKDMSGIVLDVYLMGAPVPADSASWTSIRSVVAGRLVNGYSSSDWILRFVYRASQICLSVAGIMPIQVDGVDNVNLSQVVPGHSYYAQSLPDCLDAMAFQ